MSGLSMATLGSSEPRLAFLVIAAAIDYYRAASVRHYPSRSDMNALFELLRQTTRRLQERQRAAPERVLDDSTDAAEVASQRERNAS